tara:strand:+ start:4379 stop:5716 length:1338 start_codon:yes stop_codon:yes gene_type:complete
MILLSFLSCNSEPQKNNYKTFLVDFESIDVGHVKCYIEIQIENNKITGGTIKNSYRKNYGFIDRTIIKLFSGIKNNRLISLDGICKQTDSNHIKYSSVFSSPIGNYVIYGSIENDWLEGRIIDNDSTLRGLISGSLVPNNEPVPITDYQQITTKIDSSFKSNFFNPGFTKEKTYRKFITDLSKYATESIDDIHYIFSFFYYARSLPYSHVNLWKPLDENSELNKTKDEEALNLELKDNVAVLKINSFSSEKGIIATHLQKIIAADVENLIIDLRNNPGGNIGPAIELAQFLISDTINGGYFLSRPYFEKPLSFEEKSCHVFSAGTIEDFMHDLNNHACIKLTVFPNAQTFKGNTYILINNRTASTCEPIVYGLKSEKKVKVIGQTTAGKMLSAKEVHLSDGYSLFVPTADYITNDKERLDGKGVEPDISLKKNINALDYTLDLVD